MMMQGAIFDMDGTLLDSMPLWDNAGALYLASLGFQAEQDLSKRLFAMTTAQAAAYMKHTYSLPLSVAEIVDGIHRTVENFYFYKAQLKPGVAIFLQQLHMKGIPLAVATVTDRICTEAALERTGVLHLFAAVLTTDDVGCGKDQPEIYRHAAQAMGTLPEHTFVFEDALYAVRTANSAGFITVGVYDNSSREMQETMRRESRFYLHDFTDFSDFEANILE